MSEKNPSKELQHLATMKKLDSADKRDHSKYFSSIIYYAYKLDDVRRLQTVKTLRPYPVSLHCYHVTMIYIELCLRLQIPVRNDVVEKVLMHDIVEAVTGDVIYPVKNFSGKTALAWSEIETEMIKDTELEYYTDDKFLNSFLPDEWRLFRAADLYELFIFCTDEWELGNRTEGIIQVIENCIKYIPDFGIGPIDQAVDSWTYK